MANGMCDNTRTITAASWKCPVLSVHITVDGNRWHMWVLKGHPTPSNTPYNSKHLETSGRGKKLELGSSPRLTLSTTEYLTSVTQASSCSLRPAFFTSANQSKWQMTTVKGNTHNVQVKFLRYLFADWNCKRSLLFQQQSREQSQLWSAYTDL